MSMVIRRMRDDIRLGLRHGRLMEFFTRALSNFSGMGFVVSIEIASNVGINPRITLRKLRCAEHIGTLLERSRDLLAGFEKSSIGTGTAVSQSECDNEKNGHLTHSDFIHTGFQIWKY